MNHAEAVKTQRRLNSECKALTLKALSGSNPQCPQGRRSGLDQVATQTVPTKASQKRTSMKTKSSNTRKNQPRTSMKYNTNEMPSSHVMGAARESTACSTRRRAVAQEQWQQDLGEVRVEHVHAASHISHRDGGPGRGHSRPWRQQRSLTTSTASASTFAMTKRRRVANDGKKSVLEPKWLEPNGYGAAAPLISHVLLYFSQRLIFICGTGVLLSSEGFAINFQSI